jgi:hypothetical protein
MSRDAGRAHIHFLRTQIEIGQMFADMAKQTHGPARERTRQYAQQAYDTAINFLTREPLDTSASDSIHAALARLRSSLDAIAETPART